MATTSIPPAANRIDRRGFLAKAGAGLTLAFCLPEVPRVAELQASAAVPGLVNTWLKIGTDGTVSLTIGASEMGQGSFSALAQVLAEELMVDYAKVVTIQGAPSLASVQPIGASVNTVGSSVTRTNFWKMRDAGAGAREMLVQAAMNRQADQARANFTVHLGVVTHTPSQTAYSYGSLADDASKLTPPTAPPLVPDAQFQLIGKTQARFDIPAKTDGSAKYGIDIWMPGMVYGIVKHGPCFGATLSNTPTAPRGMKAIPVKVIAGTGRGAEVTGAVNAVVLVGPNTWDTWQAVNGLRLTWTIPAAAANWNTAQFVSDAQALCTSAAPYSATPGAANGPGTLYTVEGDEPSVNSALAGAAKPLDVQYTLPYVAHATMEVLNCTVNYVAGKSCEIWAPTQNAKAVLALAAQITLLDPSLITVHTTYLGGGLGRKAEVDFVSQAIQAAMVAGAPIKVMWPRDQDFTRDQYRPMAVVHGKSGLDSAGNIAGWYYRNVSPSILGQRGVPLGPKGDSQGIEGAQALPYNFGPRVTEWVSGPSPIPVGFWRSVGASINTFCVESMIDELAALAGTDPYLFRRSKLTDPRWIAVLDAAAALGNWHTAPPSGHYRGIAIGTAFNTVVAEVVEISNVTATGLRVTHVACAIDLYLPVNPGQIEAQLQGGIVHGMNAALYGQQTFVKGTAQATNFNRSRMIRMGEMPQIDVTIMPGPAVADRTVNIGGAGELGVPTFAPALANAYFKATGKRQRSLPFFPGATMSD